MINRELFERVKATLRAYPHFYDQHRFRPNICGSAFCLAGHMVVASDPTLNLERMETFRIMDVATSASGLTSDQRDVLFSYGEGWPEPFTLSAEMSPRDQVERACAFLDYIADGKFDDPYGEAK